MLAQLAVGDVVNQQRQFFASGKTKDISFRLEQLKILKQALLENEPAINLALKADLKKPEFETFLTEIALCVKEIDDTLKHLKSWTKPIGIIPPLSQLISSAQICYEPLGVVLIIGAWNYPLQLVIGPLIGAIAAGNCAILKPSELAENTSRLVADIVEKNFDPSFVAAIEGGKETSQQLLEEKFDKIFFTGSTEVGKIVMSAAAKHLTPVTLELGGKSPCIVDANTHLEYTAKRITWGKFVNGGQTCVAPDYLLVDRRVKSDLLARIKTEITNFFGDNPAGSPDYTRIVNQRHFNRLSQLLESGEIIVGGESNLGDLYIAPTVIDRVTWEHPVMQEEIFGPILPVIEYDDLDRAIAWINAKPKPLALYFFSNDKQKQQQVLRSTSSGGVCINDTLMHCAFPALPFGGVGASGMGNYHGKAGFDTFSHQKSILKKSFLVDFNLRYAPYKDKIKVLKKILGSS
ncbi:MAG: aldehyde dehydrogenase [Cyanosarcina radialis HA8281-LM2]|jgi:acyl-CoA reductase-like NAD-dependent aldehyde dehydrogenase|nr:aldehyde dehydrogenase [Cyanosarcina radialis HA8281-LM2]